MSEAARSVSLEVEGLRSGYHGVTVLKGLDFTVGNEIFAVLGANGAGKTTLLATLARLIPLMAGRIRFQGEDVSGLPPYETAGRGIGYVPQEKGTFPDLTVLENLSVGGMIGKRSRDERMAEVLDLFPDLRDLRAQKAGTLSGGESRMVACGRALMQDPRVLLLDEPTAGLSPLYVDMFFDKIKEIHETRGVAIVLAEQNATKALQVADRVMVLSLGEAFAVMDAGRADDPAAQGGIQDLTTQAVGTRQAEEQGMTVDRFKVGTHRGRVHGARPAGHRMQRQRRQSTAPTTARPRRAPRRVPPAPARRSARAPPRAPPVAICELAYVTGEFAPYGPALSADVVFPVQEVINLDPPLGRPWVNYKEDLGTVGEAQAAKTCLEKDGAEIMVSIAHGYRNYRDYMMEYWQEKDAPIGPSIHGGLIPGNLGGKAAEPIFRAQGLDEGLGVYAAEYAQSIGAKKIVIFATQVAGFQIAANAAEKAAPLFGLEVLQRIDEQPELPSYAAVAQKIAQLKPDAVIVQAGSVESATLITQAAEAGLSLNWIGETGWSQAEFMNKLAKTVSSQKAIGYAAFSANTTTPAWTFYQPLRDAWVAKSGVDAAAYYGADNPYAFSAYDVLVQTALAVEIGRLVQGEHLGTGHVQGRRSARETSATRTRTV